MLNSTSLSKSIWKNERHRILGLTAIIFGLLALHNIYANYLGQMPWRYGAREAYFLILGIGLFTTPIGGWLDRLFVRHKWILWLGAVAVAVFLANKFYRPGYVFANDPGGVGDQRAYIIMLKQMLGGGLKSQSYIYGLGYPGLGYAAHWIFPQDPFRFVNYVSFLATLGSIWGIVRHYSRSLSLATLVSVAMANNVYALGIADIWTSSAVIGFVSVSILILITGRREPWSLVFLGVATGVVFATRYVDAILLLFIWPYLLWESYSLRGSKAAEGAVTKRAAAPIWVWAGGLVAFAIIAGVFYSHYHYFGDILKNPYHLHTRPDTVSDAHVQTYTNRMSITILLRIFGTLIDPKSTSWDWAGGSLPHLQIPLFAKAIFLYVGVIATMFLGKIGRNLGVNGRENRWLWVSVAAGALGYLLIYGLHPGGYPGCLVFGSEHYYRQILPFLVPVGAIFCFQAAKGQIPAKSIAVRTGLLTVFFVSTSVIGLYYTPRSYEVAFDQKPEAEKIVVTVHLTNRWGGIVPNASYGDFGPHGKLNVTDMDGKRTTKHFAMTEVKIDGTVAWTAEIPYGELDHSKYKRVTFTSLGDFVEVDVPRPSAAIGAEDSTKKAG